MTKIYKQYSVKYYNNDNQLRREYVYADNHNQAMDHVIIRHNIYKARITSVAWHKTVTL